METIKSWSNGRVALFCALVILTATVCSATLATYAHHEIEAAQAQQAAVRAHTSAPAPGDTYEFVLEARRFESEQQEVTLYLGGMPTGAHPRAGAWVSITLSPEALARFAGHVGDHRRFRVRVEPEE
jgi:hypothetical protein